MSLPGMEIRRKHSHLGPSPFELVLVLVLAPELALVERLPFAPNCLPISALFLHISIPSASKSTRRGEQDIP